VTDAVVILFFKATFFKEKQKPPGGIFEGFQLLGAEKIMWLLRKGVLKGYAKK